MAEGDSRLKAKSRTWGRERVLSSYWRVTRSRRFAWQCCVIHFGIYRKSQAFSPERYRGAAGHNNVMLPDISARNPPVILGREFFLTSLSQPFNCGQSMARLMLRWQGVWMVTIRGQMITMTRQKSNHSSLRFSFAISGLELILHVTRNSVHIASILRQTPCLELGIEVPLSYEPRYRIC